MLSGERLKFFSRPKVQGATLNELWSNRLYDEIIIRCNEALQNNPVDYFALVYKGFSYFYKSASEISLEDKIPNIEEAIVCLRRARLREDEAWRSETAYVLGKAYYHKGKYYYDLAIEYLTQALSAGYEGVDIYDYLGLSYNQLGMIEQGLEYFIKAVEIHPTDLLLLTVGQNYFELKRTAEAEEYLIRAINKTDDPAVTKKSRFLLGQLYFENKDFFKAENEYQQILKIDPRSADAHFYLGEIYQSMNDSVKARAEWRKTLIIDPEYYGAKLRYYK